MAGTLTIGTLSDGTNSTSATDAIKGSAKAWVNFNGVTTATVRASYNVSSVTRNGAGDYTINFTNAMVDANYAVLGMNDDRSGGDGWPQLKYANGTYPPSTTSCRVITGKYPGSSANDATHAMFAIFR